MRCSMVGSSCRHAASTTSHGGPPSLPEALTNHNQTGSGAAFIPSLLPRLYTCEMVYTCHPDRRPMFGDHLEVLLGQVCALVDLH
jgi:hypothetical protein